VRVDVLRVKGEGSPVLDLGPHRVALVRKEVAEIFVRVDILRVEGNDGPVLGLSSDCVALFKEEVAEIAESYHMPRVENKGSSQHIFSLRKLAVPR
jgi:hypothetical protein